MKNFQIDQSQEESPHSFETAAGDIFYGTSWHFVLQTSPARCHHSTVESGETSSRNDLGTATIQKKFSTFTIVSLFIERTCNRVYPRRQKLLETYGLISECMKFSRLHRFNSMESNRAAIINFSDSNHAAILMSHDS
mmetsp:Transcript_3540/g.7470  ORF Transcript_3540/g.7470 Transcript_3540/m.7470 type:complete len:137 (+) Transcript_3540:462-872(+)